jgi:putative MFS transporter
MTGPVTTVDQAIERIGLGRFQWRLFWINGLVWASDAMEIIAIGFVIPSIVATFAVGPGAAGLIGSLFFAGMMVGAWGFGVLADRWGRRTVFLITIAMNALFALLSAFAPTFVTLLLFRFLTGAAVGGTLPVDYSLTAEYLPKAQRGRFLVYLESFWAVGTVAIALIAWAIVPAMPEDGWRWIFAINALPGLLGLLVRLWVPESPRFLLLQGRAEEARQVLERVARMNRTPVPVLRLAPLVPPRGSTTAALFGPTLRKRTLRLAVVWFGLSYGYYGVFTWLRPIFVGQGVEVLQTYWFLVVLATAQVPGYLLAAYLVERIGRRPTLALFLLGSAGASMFFALSTAPAVVIGASLLLSFSLLGAWGALYAYTPEVYPTEVRATGMGFAGAVARAAGIVAAQLGGLLLALSFPVALSIYALALALAGAAALAMRERTEGRPLEESVQRSPESRQSIR